MEKYLILPALNAESLETWVWCRDAREHKGFVVIKNKTSGKKITVYQRRIDENFIRNYNKRVTEIINEKKEDSTTTSSQTPLEIPKDESQNCLIINEFYREQLDMNTGLYKETELYIKKANWWNKLWMLFKPHPHPTVRIASYVALVALILGIIPFIWSISKIAVFICNIIKFLCCC